jgi:hypothetical protein
MLTLTVKSQSVCYKLDETIEQPCSDFPSTTAMVGTYKAQEGASGWV